MADVRNRKNKPGAAKPVGGDGQEIQTGVTTQTQGLLQAVRDRVNFIYRDAIDPVAEPFRYRSRPSKGEITASPLVFFLGNHSSGKSSFVNFLLNRETLQKTGTAPLDDCFTILSYGDQLGEKDGPAICANKQMPFSGLGKIGGDFVNHLRMKMVPDALLRNVTLVDSPGMIDSMGDGRGYNFVEAVKWFAERADIICFFFDPEKPGTTGESLKVFTEALGSVDHKLLLVMNKVDTLLTLSDLSRTFGTLCWNLSKAISTKDMPYIHLSFIPGHEHKVARKFDLSEFDGVRDEIVHAIRAAPKKRADNVITDMKVHAENLLLHARVISAARNELWWWRTRALFTVFVALAVSVALVLLVSDEPGVRLRLAALPVVVLLVSLVLYPRYRRQAEAQFTTPAHLRGKFEQLYAAELLSDEEEIYERTWASSSTGIENVVRKFPLLSFPSSVNIKALSGARDAVQELLEKVHKSLNKIQDE